MSDSSSERIVIVGGGFSGLSLAVSLAKAGLPVTLVEALQLGAGASTRIQGWLHSGGVFARQQPQLARLCFESLQQILRYCPACVEPDHEGMLYLFTSTGMEHREWSRAWNDVGIPFESVTRDRVAERMPQLDLSEIELAYLLPDRSFRPEVLLEQLAADARNGGAEIRLETPIARLLTERNEVHGVVTSHGEEIQACRVILATGSQDWSGMIDASSQAVPPVESEHLLAPPAGASNGDLGTASSLESQTEYTRVVLKTHLISIRPDIGSWPFCLVDQGCFNHLPHLETSVFGSNHWKVVHGVQDASVEPEEIARIWENVQRFVPGVKREDCHDVHEWSGTAAQIMHVEQIEPGQCPLPTVVNHCHERPCYRNLWSVSPGRATLWPQMAEETRERILTDMGRTTLHACAPPWSVPS